jgi:hypothetical protein
MAQKRHNLLTGCNPGTGVVNVHDVLHVYLELIDNVQQGEGSPALHYIQYFLEN